MRRAPATSLAAVAVALLLVGGGQSAPQRLSLSAAAGEELPDLDQETPSDLAVTALGSGSEKDYVLGFRSAVRNVGAGPLILDGHRSDASNPFMTVDQVVDRADGSQTTVAGVGRMVFAISPDHRHWHYLQFDRYGLQRYELRAAGAARPLVRDRKTGFCLGDRYRVTDRLVPNAVPDKIYRTNCGLNQTQLLEVREGISVGYGDDYKAFLEGQDLPLTGLPGGRYILVHRVNENRRLRELNYGNDAASVLLDLRWQRGVPAIRILRACSDTAVCKLAKPSFRVRTVATGLRVPWDIAFLPHGGALVTERPGTVRLLTARGRLREAPVARIHVSTAGEGGLLGLVLDPAFARNGFVYLYFTGPTSMELERWRWTGLRLAREATLVDAIASGQVHDSGRIAVGPDRKLYVATGDAGRPALAQDPASLNGKFLTLTPRQYHGDGLVRPAILASGLRNPQGFDWQPGSGKLIANDHGPTGFDGPHGFDEVNRIVAGGNYGWPDVIGSATGSGRFIAPIRVYPEAIAPSGATFVRHRGSPWRGDYVLAALKGEQLRLLKIRGGAVVSDDAVLTGTFGRLRTVREAPDGSLYVLTSNRDGRGAPRAGDDRIVRIEFPRR
jgi:glucose/arabinose dehydrogenase